jgi:hypothetical protein
MKPIRLGWRDVPGLVFVVLAVVGMFYITFKYPNWRRPSGFGPEWSCTPSGRSGPSFCVKKPEESNAKQE